MLWLEGRPYVLFAGTHEYRYLHCSVAAILVVNITQDLFPLCFPGSYLMVSFVMIKSLLFSYAEAAWEAMKEMRLLSVGDKTDYISWLPCGVLPHLPKAR